MNQISHEKKKTDPVDLHDPRDTKYARWILYAILIAAAYISVSYAFHLMLAKPLAGTRLNVHEVVINETAPLPTQYRILTYYIVEGIHRITGMSIARLDLILRFVFTSLSLIYLFKYMRRWFDFAFSAIGSLIILAVLPVTYIDYWHQPHDIPNLFFTILALMVIRDRCDAWLLLLIPVAMLNRESFIFVLWVWFFFNYDRIPVKLFLGEFVLFSGVSLVVYLSLWHYFGQRESHVATIQLANNLDPQNIWKWSTRLLAFAGPLIVGSIVRFKSKPLFLRRASGYVIVFMIANFLVAKYQETRLFLPILPVIIPLGLASVFPVSDTVKQEDRNNSTVSSKES